MADIEGVIRGAVIAESLRPGTTLRGCGMTVVRMSRYDVPTAAEHQSPVWTLVEFEAPADIDAALADALAASLLPRGWYANWNSSLESTVVFPGRVFRYPRGDERGRAEAEAHGRACDVPEAQLDWGE
jgi:hypothetical protein